MPILLKCIECGKPLSSQAAQCTHCQSRYPLGVKCIVCCQVLRRAEAIKIKKEYGGAENRISVKFFHPDCYQQVGHIRIGRSRAICPVCQRSMEFDTSSYTTCSHCGQSFPTNLADPSFAACCYCGFRLNKSLEVAVKEASRPFLEGWVTETVYAHRICYTSERQEEEKRLLAKEQREKERLYPQKAATRHNQKAERKIEALISSVFIGLFVGVLIGGISVTLNFILRFGYNWQVAGIWGFGSAFILTIISIWVINRFE